MKHLLKIALGLVLCLCVFTACDDDDNAAVSGFSLSKTEVAANAEGGKETVSVSSEGEWVAKSSEPWLNISPANGFGNTECVITFRSSEKRKLAGVGFPHSLFSKVSILDILFSQLHL